MYVVGVGFFRVVCKVVREFCRTQCVSCVLVGWFVGGIGVCHGGGLVWFPGEFDLWCHCV